VHRANTCHDLMRSVQTLDVYHQRSVWGVGDCGGLCLRCVESQGNYDKTNCFCFENMFWGDAVIICPVAIPRGMGRDLANGFESITAFTEWTRNILLRKIAIKDITYSSLSSTFAIDAGRYTFFICLIRGHDWFPPFGGLGYHELHTASSDTFISFIKHMRTRANAMFSMTE